jgi:hypothetical protein
MIVYDCEIVRAIPDKKKDRLRGIQYCKGWRDFAGMGVACVVAYDYDTDGFRVFCEDNLDAFQRMIHLVDVVVGYHNWNFDDPLMEAHGVKIPDKKSYDLYKEIYKAHGFKLAKRVGGMKLDDVARANFPDRGKTGDGAMAPIHWQRGLIGRVIDYCMGDVLLTRDLLDLVIRGELRSPKTGRILRVRPPK